MKLTRLIILVAWLAPGWVLAASAGSAYPIVVSEEDRIPSPADVARAVDAWLSCYECNQGELRAVLAAGAAAVGRLGVAADRGEVQVLTRQRQALERSYVALRSHADATGRDLDISADAYLRRKLEAFTLLRAARARRALDLIAAGGAVEP